VWLASMWQSASSSCLNSIFFETLLCYRLHFALGLKENKAYKYHELSLQLQIFFILSIGSKKYYTLAHYLGLHVIFTWVNKLITRAHTKAPTRAHNSFSPTEFFLIPFGSPNIITAAFGTALHDKQDVVPGRY